MYNGVIMTEHVLEFYILKIQSIKWWHFYITDIRNH